MSNRQTELRTGAWYGDHTVTVPWPDDWDVTVFWPQTPPALSDDQLMVTLDKGGGAMLQEMCRGKSRPLVIIDDLNRPTPTDRILPWVLRQFERAGIRHSQVTILLATGTHGAPRQEALARKVGSTVAKSCRVLVHNAARAGVRVGTTSFGTPVRVNRELTTADFVMGIGGIYPNHTAGFGGGSKLALGVLNRRSIMHLHYGHKGAGWGAESTTGFRKELDEIASLIGLRFAISVQVNSDREMVRVVCGDPLQYFPGELAFALKHFEAPVPDEADVVVSNAYPDDLSLTFVRKKGTTPLRVCGNSASRIVIGACSEGAGDHWLFPFVNQPRFHRFRQIYRRASVLGPGGFLKKLRSRLRSRYGADPHRGSGAPHGHTNPTWLFRPPLFTAPLPGHIPGMRLASSWEEILRQVRAEQAGKQRLRVLVYPCAPLQSLSAVASTPNAGSRVLAEAHAR